MPAKTQHNPKIKRVENKTRRKHLHFWERKSQEAFLENLCILFDSGMDIETALETLIVETRQRRMKELIREMKEDISDGSPTWKALENSALVPHSTLQLLKLGEENGLLAQNMKVLLRQLRKERMLKTKMHSTMLYPLFVLALTLIVGIGVVTFSLPRLSNIFLGLDIPLPWITRSMITMGQFLDMYGVVVIPLFLVILSTLFYLLFFHDTTKHIGQKILLKVPGTRKLLRDAEIARFGYVVGELLGCGLPILDALDSLATSTQLISYKKLYLHLRVSVEEGSSLKESFEEFPKSDTLIPFSLQQIIATSEQSGGLAQSLLVTAKIFEEKTEESQKTLTTLLEPVLLIIVWLAILFIALSVVLPLYNLIGGLEQG